MKNNNYPVRPAEQINIVRFYAVENLFSPASRMQTTAATYSGCVRVDATLQF